MTVCETMKHYNKKIEEMSLDNVSIGDMVYGREQHRKLCGVCKEEVTA